MRGAWRPATPLGSGAKCSSGLPMSAAFFGPQRSPGNGVPENKGPVRAAYDAEVKRFSIRTGSPSNLITSLSGGNQQKVLIGRAFARSPSIIVLNDPARGVDLGTKVELYEELRRYAANGGAVLYLSSEIEEFLDFADRVAVFHKGTLFRVLRGEDRYRDGVNIPRQSRGL